MSASRGALAANSSACMPAHGLQRTSAFSYAREQAGMPVNCSIPLIRAQGSDLCGSRRPSMSHRCHGWVGSDLFYCSVLFSPSGVFLTSDATAEFYIAPAHVVTSERPLLPEFRSVAVPASVYDLRVYPQYRNRRSPRYAGTGFS